VYVAGDPGTELSEGIAYKLVHNCKNFNPTVPVGTLEFISSLEQLYLMFIGLLTVLNHAKKRLLKYMLGCLYFNV
jgi:hypothetical protein